MPRFVAITPEQFGNKTWKHHSSYAFASTLNILPIVAAELAQVVPTMPLGFVQTEQAFELVAVTSFQPGTNLFVAPDGRWIGAYIPAALRGAPFRLIKLQDGDNSALCFDEESGLLADGGSGEPFFDQTGAPGAALKNVLDFLSQVENSRAATQRAVEALAQAGVIESWPLQVRKDGKTLSVEGLHRINESALNALEGEKFLALRDIGALAIAYAQLFSMHQLGALSRLAAAQVQMQAQAQAFQSQKAGIASNLDLIQENGTLKFS